VKLGLSLSLSLEIMNIASQFHFLRLHMSVTTEVKQKYFIFTQTLNFTKLDLLSIYPFGVIFSPVNENLQYGFYLFLWYLLVAVTYHPMDTFHAVYSYTYSLWIS
jgi:hypothetical protein